MLWSEALNIRPGLIAFVGAGGKTSSIHLLAQELHQRGERVAVTTTTHILSPQERWMGAPLLSPDEQQVREAAKHGICVAAEGIDERGKLTDIGPERLALLVQYFTYVLVEADGSRRMPCKVPAKHEPVIPPRSCQVVGVLGMKALGKPLQQVCFRAPLAAQLLQVPEDTMLMPQHLAALACSMEGLQKNVDGRPFVLVLNQTELAPQAAQETAQLCLCQGISRVVCTSLKEKSWKVFAPSCMV